MNDQQPVQLRVGLAQVDTRVGDLSGNAELVTEWTAKAAGDGAHLVVFPEMTLTGYPAAFAVQVRTRSAFPARSPTRVSTWARPTRSCGRCC